MEEGFMLTFPQRVLRGEIPNRDFLHLYGPGSVWVLAGFFKVFGDALATERTVGLLQQMGLVFGVFMLARHWGRALATFASVITLLIIVPPIGLTALAWVGAVALGLWSLWFALEARRAPDGRRARRFALAAGFAGGLALLYRPDLVVAVTGALVVALWGSRYVALRRPLIVGAAIGLAPYIVHLATAGLTTAVRGMVLDPVVYLRGGRRLPIPPRPGGRPAGFLQRSGEIYELGWPLPKLSTADELTVWFVLLIGAAAALVAIGIHLVRRRPGWFRARVILAVGVFCVGLLPQGVQRTDSAHFAWASCVSLGFLPVAIATMLEVRAPRLNVRARQAVAGIGVLVLLIALIPKFVGRSYADYALQSFGRHRLAYRIHYEGRTFYYGRADVQEALRGLLPDIDRVSRPGDRLLVGPSDFRKTPYSEAFIYYLFPELRPGTYYIEMDPGVANRTGSRLAGDVARSDVIVLSSVWDDWDEPNDSRKIGSDEPNRVLERQFCQVGEYGGLFQLYTRRAEGSSCP
jgi:hypothetical protein